MVHLILSPLLSPDNSLLLKRWVGGEEGGGWRWTSLCSSFFVVQEVSICREANKEGKKEGVIYCAKNFVSFLNNKAGRGRKGKKKLEGGRAF